LLMQGPEYLKTVRAGLEQWLNDHGYDSLRQMRGNISQLRCATPEAFERGNYVKILQSWRTT
jgi:dihydroorotate dehydrogenase (fumarate)